ncbi:hypothetical protein [Natronobacterium texcoconense]|uniref:Major facilitator superfamily (MFS) profile domain-containing protein n=1 Tax=Natronobacterium texcoconense TaxID=1095778 RepID=A0A1H1HVK7_NATTX|nr:hypothetical protein [Natronobacterium texcoconense]SDR29491.1 hypothetical protein SAMN04489842_3087 [Natronobacterium texcoconense]
MESNTDDGATELGQDEIYLAVREGIKDALFDVFATIFLLGLALGSLWAGFQGFAAASSAVGYVLAGTALGLALVFVAAAFDLVPSFHDRLLS